MSDGNGNLPQVQRQRAVVTDEEALFDTAKFDQIARVAGVMGKSSLLPDHLRVLRTENGALVTKDTPKNVPVFLDVEATTANAFLIVNQARLFGGIDPFALAQSSYFVHGRLGFEGKLIQAIIERRVGSMEFEYFGEPGTDDYGIKVTGWVPGADPARKASISGTVLEWQTTKYGGEVLQQWKGKAGQTRMLHYRGTREWGRMHSPGLVLGLLDEDDLEAIRENHRADRARPVGPGAPAPAVAQGQAGAAVSYNPLRDEDGDVEEAQEVKPGPAKAATVAQEGPGQAPAPEASKGATDAAPPAGAPATVKRAPRGANARLDRLELQIQEAKTVGDVNDLWNGPCRDFFAEMVPSGWDTTAAYDRLDERRATRIAVLENADPKTGEVKGKPAAQVAQDEVAQNLATALREFENAAGLAQKFDDLDSLVEEMVNPHPFNHEQEREVDAIVDRERTRIAAAQRMGEGEASREDRETPAGNADPDHFPGDDPMPGKASGPAHVPLTEEQLQETVDGWVTSMRKCKTVADLERFNVETVTPFMQGPDGPRLNRDQVADARETFENRRNLLSRKA